MPKVHVDAKKCPKLNQAVCLTTRRPIKATDTDVAAPPVVNILEIDLSGNLMIETSVKAAQLTLRLLANVLAHISRRGERPLKEHIEDTWCIRKTSDKVME